MIDFYENKSLKNKSKNELIQSLILFRLIKNKLVFKIISFVLIVFVKIRFPFLKYIIKKTVYKQFCGGENIYQTQDTIIKLKNNNIKTSLDFVAENKKTKKDFQQYIKELKLMIKFAKKNKVDFIVIKISGLLDYKLLKKVNKNEKILKQEEEVFIKTKSQIFEICENAKEKEIKVLFDAEESWIQNTIDNIVLNIMYKINKTDFDKLLSFDK